MPKTRTSEVCQWDEIDLNQHIDTIHYNPVRHGLVKRVCDWPWSSFHRYVRMGAFGERHWGAAIEEQDGWRYGE